MSIFLILIIIWKRGKKKIKGTFCLFKVRNFFSYILPVLFWLQFKEGLNSFDKDKMVWWFSTPGKRVFLFLSVHFYYLPCTISGTCLTPLLGQFRLLEGFC